MRIHGAITVLAAESATTWASGNVVDSTLTGGQIGLRIREDGNLANLEISAFSGGDAQGAFRPIP